MKKRNKNKMSSKQGNMTYIGNQLSRSLIMKKLRKKLNSVDNPMIRKKKGEIISKKGKGTSMDNQLKNQGKVTGKKQGEMSNYQGQMFSRMSNCVLLSHKLKKQEKLQPRNLNGSIDSIPENLLEDIFKTLPVKYILRCRCVQKSWNRLIKTRSFITLHRNHQNFAAHKFLFVRDLRDFSLTLRSDDAECQEYCKIRLLPGLPQYAFYAVSYGLICLTNICYSFFFKNDRNIYVWNPLIQKYKTLPDSPLPPGSKPYAWEAFAFGFVHEINDYLMVHLTKPHFRSNPHKLYIGIYSLNTNSWKKIRWPNVSICNILMNNNVFVNGSAFWVGFNRYKHKILLCFDTKTQVVREILFPEWLDGGYDTTIVHPFGQSIAYFVRNKNLKHLAMWVLNGDPMNEFTWEKKMSVTLSYGVGLEVLGVRNNGEPILYNSLKDDVISFNLDSLQTSDFVHSWDNSFKFVYSPFVESLVLLDVD